MKDPLEKRLIATLVVIFLVLVATTITTVRALHRSVASNDWVNHSHALILEADAILSSLNAAETSLRDHLLTGEARDQDLYRQRLSDVLEHLEVTRALARSQSAAFKEVEALASVIRRKLDLDRGAIQARSQDGAEAARKALYAEGQAALMRQVQRHVDGIKNEQKTLLQERNRAVYLHAQSTSWALCGGFALNFLLLGFGFWLVRDDLTVRRRAAEAMRKANDHLEARVNKRTQELGQAVAALTEENLERRWKNEALEHQLRYSHLIFDSITDLVLVVTRNLHVVRVNPAVVHHTGFSSAELLGSPLQRGLSLDQGDAPGSRTWERVFGAGRDVVSVPGQLHTQEGHSLSLRFNVCPVRDQDKVVGAVIVARLEGAEWNENKQAP